MRLIAFAVLSLVIGANLAAEIPVTLLASDESPVPVGTVVVFEAVPAVSVSTLTYRFSVRNPNEDFHIVRDYSRIPSLTWTALDEGTYEIEVTVRDSATGEIDFVSVQFTLKSRLAPSGAAAVSDTHHPLVFLYSAPACPEGSSIRVEFRPKSGGRTTSTPARPCLAEGSMNFWLAGLQKNTSFVAHHVVNNVAAKRDLEFRTGAEIPLEFFPQTPVVGPSQSPDYPYVVHSALGERPSATDLDGNLVWYYPELLTSLTRVEQGGRMWGFLQDLSGPPEAQVLREFDLAGITLRETDAAAINEQLKVRGVHAITGFHHEARSLPGGKVVALASSEQHPDRRAGRRRGRRDWRHDPCPGREHAS